MASTGRVSTLVLVEGESDANAVRALAARVGCDLEHSLIDVVSACGITNFARVLAAYVQDHPEARVAGMYDVAEEWHVRRALSRAGRAVISQNSLETAGFFGCIADLEDELIRALGPASVECIVDEQSELTSFRRFQAMPEHRASSLHKQLHRFLGTRATRKVRSAPRLVEALDLERIPRPLAKLAGVLREACVA